MRPSSNSFNSWYLQKIGNYQPSDYLLSIIAYHSAPVLEGEKPAVLLTLGNAGNRKLNEVWLKNREQLPAAGNFRYFELLRIPERTVVLFYHPGLLQEVLWEESAADYLRSCGYRKELTVETALADLKTRYRTGCPHEIGIFLGIPLPDVLGFIANRGKKALANGYWKVYHDPAPKLALFSRYQQAKDGFVRFMMAGKGPQDYLWHKIAVITEQPERLKNNSDVVID
ncbi:MAG TPA: DUF3793 family protein [Bacillota bacterium]